MRFEPIGRRAVLVILSTAALVAGVRTAAGEANPECAWSDRFGASDLWRLAETMVVFDDGTGEALYVGGTVVTAGGRYVGLIARWDGTSWSPLTGPLGTGVDDTVADLAVFDDGSGPALYAGGWFEHVDGIAAQGVARWDGTAWSAVVPPSAGGRRLVQALTVHDDGSGPALWIGGDFRQLGGVPADRIARWDGRTLSEPAAGGIEGKVQAMVSWNDGSGSALYVGGTLTEAGGTAVGHIARLAGGSWSRLGAGAGHGMNYFVSEFAVYDDGNGPAIYAAGDFTLGGDSETFHVARWTGGGWAPLIGRSGPRFDVDGEVGALAVYDDGRGPALYVGGWFVTLDGEPVGSLARWDGVAWSAVDPANPLLTVFRERAVAGKVYSLGVFDDGRGPTLYVGGSFTHVGDLEVNYVARWDGTAWSGLGSGVLSTGGIYEFEVWDDGTGPALYVGGGFLEAGGIETRVSLARWDGSNWSPLVDAGGLDLRGTVSALEVFDDGTGPALYAGGTLRTQFPFHPGVFRWNGSHWQGLGTRNLGGLVWDLEAFDDGTGPALYAGGSFDEVGLSDSIRVDHVARWDGTGWTALIGPGGPGTFPGDGVFALAADPNRRALWVGGDFALAGGIPSNYVARWTCDAAAGGFRFKLMPW
jgi:hypothetical protein